MINVAVKSNCFWLTKFKKDSKNSNRKDFIYKKCKIFLQENAHRILFLTQNFKFAQISQNDGRHSLYHKKTREKRGGERKIKSLTPVGPRCCFVFLHFPSNQSGRRVKTRNWKREGKKRKCCCKERFSRTRENK